MRRSSPLLSRSLGPALIAEVCLRVQQEDLAFLFPLPVSLWNLVPQESGMHLHQTTNL